MYLKTDFDRLPGRTFAAVAKEASKLGLGRKAKPIGPMFSLINRLMADRKPRTAKEVASALASRRTSVWEALDGAVKRGEYHIAGYGIHPDHARNEAAYVIGKGKSAVKPRPETSAERARRFRKEVDKVEHSFKRKQYTLNQKIKRGGVKRDSLSSALYGSAA
ncbi:hypothetical protein PPMP20_04340 [Paraburkholderia phymatum]|uniref:hypothetical protein n=1 Tax=Paraburkholderia phymatum TaxID=148447 RepID=UPI0000E7DF93|nr:hypothetical protein [Paraburkholderia phymatum]